jgi:hypothetical protein
MVVAGRQDVKWFIVHRSWFLIPGSSFLAPGSRTTNESAEFLSIHPPHPNPLLSEEREESSLSLDRERVRVRVN